MADVPILECATPLAGEIYRAVNSLIGVDPTDGSGDWPDGMISHVAGESGDKRNH